MYFALGFLVAGLFALMFLPAFWRRALRLSMRRLQMLAPMSMEEVVAERDLLRAEFAVRERRLEQTMEATQEARASDLATIGRHIARIADLESQLGRAEADNRDMETRLGQAEQALVERVELLNSTEAALHEMTDRAERRVARLRLVESDTVPPADESETPPGVLAYESRVAALHQHNAEMQRAVQTLREEHARAEQSAARTAELEDQLTRLSEELAAARAQGETLSAELGEARAQLNAAQQRQERDVGQLDSALRAAHDNAGALEAARADNAMLQGAVEALRAERAALRRGANGAKTLSVVPVAASDAEIASLRETIRDFGDRVVAHDLQAPAKRA